jgi:pimeloyl-ACP methyl ester carboxylesterase
VLAVLIALGIFVLEGLELLALFILIHPRVRVVKETPVTFGIADYEDVTFASVAGDVMLQGWLIHRVGSERTVIICHGQGDNRFETLGPGGKGVHALEVTKLFLDLGYNTFLFDFRGQGNSPGNPTLGIKEQQDLLGAISFVKSRGIGSKIGVVGYSLGAGVALAVLNRTKDVSFVIADSAPSDLRELLEDKIKDVPLLGRFPAKQLLFVNLQVVFGIPVADSSPITSLATSNVPVLLLYGERDALLKEGKELIVKCKNPHCSLFVFAGTDHVQAFDAERPQYRQKVLEFLRSLDTS